MNIEDDYKPIISIITVVLNNPKGLINTIESVINQNCSNLEFIIIDGGSDPATISVIKEFENQIDYWSSEKDNGIYDAMNKGINISRGNIIGILNSGDCYCKDTFKIVINTFKSAHRAQVVFGDVILSMKNGNQLYTASVNKRMFNDGWMPHPAVFVKKVVYHEFGCFDNKLRISADYDFMLRIHSKIKIKYIDQPLAKMQMMGFSTSNYLLKANEDYYVRKKNGMSVIRNMFLTAISIFSQAISNFIRLIFGFPEFRFESTELFSWARKNKRAFMSRIFF